MQKEKQTWKEMRKHFSAKVAKMCEFSKGKFEFK